MFSRLSSCPLFEQALELSHVSEQTDLEKPEHESHWSRKTCRCREASSLQTEGLKQIPSSYSLYVPTSYLISRCPLQTHHLAGSTADINLSRRFNFEVMIKGSLFHIVHTRELAKSEVNWVLLEFSTPGTKTILARIGCLKMKSKSL